MLQAKADDGPSRGWGLGIIVPLGTPTSINASTFDLGVAEGSPWFGMTSTESNLSAVLNSVGDLRLVSLTANESLAKLFKK